MFGLPPHRAKDHPDPMQSRRAAADWLRELPAPGTPDRDERVVEACARMRAAAARSDLERVAALQLLDTALAADRRRLLVRYFEHLAGSAQLAQHFWQAARDVGDAFALGYRGAVDAAIVRPADRRWRQLLAVLTARLISFRGAGTMLGLFRGDAIDPAAWAELHALLLQARALGFDRSPAALPDISPTADYRDVEHEYVHVLLLDLLRTGNLTPPEIDWAGTQLRAWSTGLALEPLPPQGGGFCIDLAGTVGLARCTGAVDRPDIVYLDPAPLAAQIDRALGALRELPAGDSAGARALRRRQATVLEKILPVIAPRRDIDLRIHPRVPARVPAALRVGLARIAAELGVADPPAPPPVPVPESPAPSRAAPAPPPLPECRFSWPDSSIEEIDIPPAADDTPWTSSPGARPAPPATPVAAARTPWRVDDRSTAGCRLSAPAGSGPGLALGALVGVAPADTGEWTLGVVSRIGRGADDSIEVGIALIPGRIDRVTLHVLRRPSATASLIVDGIDSAIIGAAFDGLYVAPPERPGMAPGSRTLVLPAAQYAKGRRVLLTHPGSSGAVTLGHVLDRRADWAWVTVDAATKAEGP